MSSHKIFDIQKDAIRDKSLKGKYRNVWVEESMTPSAKKTEVAKKKLVKEHLGSVISPRKCFIFSLVVLLGIVIILCRSAQLQLVGGKGYRELAEGNRIRLKPIIAERGIIYDAFYRELVQNIPDFALTMVPQDLPADKNEQNRIENSVSAISGVPYADIESLIAKYKTNSYASLVIKENLDYETALRLYIESGELPGVAIEKGSRRKYVHGSPTSSTTMSVSHILGYLGKLNENDLITLSSFGYLPFDSIGKTGLEKSYETVLRGQYGKKKVEVDALGHETKVIAQDAPLPGKNVVLTLDLEAQIMLEKFIVKELARIGKTRAAGVALDPRTGAILALISWPTFDNNDFAGGITSAQYEKYDKNKDMPLFNRAIAGAYPSGSTVKPIIAAGALQEGIINRHTTILSAGGIRLGRWFFKDWSAGGHGITNVTKAIAWSVNTFFYYIGGGYNQFVGLGLERMTNYLRGYNLGAKTGIDLPGEAAGFVPSAEWKRKIKKEQWFAGDTYNLSIGQGDLLVTPLQVAVWTAAVANGGSLIQPHLANKIEDPATGRATSLPYKNKTGPVSYSNMAIVREGMRECVTAGSCKLLMSLSFSSGAKTGTAQWREDKDSHAWFTAFAPAENPKIVVTILVEEGIQGSSASMPIARDFLDWWGKKYLR